ncbi:hypothetical protein [Sporomusa sp.]|nr:hypothetical protein [Sporomusa sp.]
MVMKDKNGRVGLNGKPVLVSGVAMLSKTADIAPTVIAIENKKWLQ